MDRLTSPNKADSPSQLGLTNSGGTLYANDARLGRQTAEFEVLKAPAADVSLLLASLPGHARRAVKDLEKTLAVGLLYRDTDLYETGGRPPAMV
jgi:hypothetical protein